ncbi:MAG: zinc ABC transporter substrate-binding protein [Terrisporobacter sp.]
MKKITAAMLIITAAFFLGLGGFSKTLMADTSESDKESRDVYLNIITTDKAQYKMLKELSGDKHNIEYMFSNFDEIKDYKYDDKAVLNISNMDLFFYSGAGNENAWIGEMIGKLNKSSLGVINLSRGIRELKYEVDNKEKVNPYYYLGIAEYKIMLYNAKSALQEKDPANRDYYSKNYDTIIKRIEDSKKEFDKNFDSNNKYTFVAEDKTFEYFFKSLGLELNVLKKGETVEEYAKAHSLKENDLVFVKDKAAKDNKNVDKYKTINLQTYDQNKGFDELITYNIEQINSLNNKNK